MGYDRQRDLMERLLNEQELYFTPLSGNFDLERVAEAIKSIRLSVRDEFVPSMFLIFLDEESRDAHLMRRRSDPSAPLPYVLLIKVEPGEICVNQFAGPEYAERSRAFLMWLAKNSACRLRNEEGTDLTAEWKQFERSAR
jgi:hypothetical protein